MSRIGIKPIPVPGTVQVDIAKGNAVKVKGPKGELSQQLSNKVKIVREDDQLLVQRESEDREIKALHGLTRSLLNNMIVGVTDGYTRVLEIQGVGYRSQLQGKNLLLNVGFSHPVNLTPPDGVSYAVEGNNKISVMGINKQVVGEEAARIRGTRPPEPYKGKGIRYQGEYVRRKAGKAGKAK